MRPLRTLKSVLIAILIQVICLGQFAFFVPQAFAADDTAPTAVPPCPVNDDSAADLPSPADTSNQNVSQAAPSASQQELDDEETDPQLTADDIGVPGQTFLAESQIKDSPYYDYMKQRLDQAGRYDAGLKGWYVCQADRDAVLANLPISQDGDRFFDTLTLDGPRIAYKNQRDYEALVGEPCRKFRGSVCDSTKVKVDANGNPLKDSNGNDITVDDPTCRLHDGYKPLYFDDLYWVNDCWDAPKVDARVLATLTYLVTPKAEGGAGRERIKVSKIIQESKKDRHYADHGTALSSGSDSTTSDSTDSSKDPVAAENSKAISSHYYIATDPMHPIKLAQGLEISEIDNIRLTTKVTQKRRLGGASVSYKYKTFPIKVAWQTEEGIPSSGGLPSLNDLYSGIGDVTKMSVLDLLQELDLDSEIDPSQVDVHSFGDIADLIGKSLLSHLLEGGTLQGYDLASNLEGYGRSYLAYKLGLPQNALSEGDDVDSLVANLGRTLSERALGLPYGSLKGGSSEAVYTNIAKRYLEQEVFDVREGTLTPDPGSHDELVKRLGAGALEQQFNLLPQSMREDDFNKVKNMSFKTKLIFSSDNALGLDERFGLAENTSADLFAGKLSFADYKKKIGEAQINATIGMFKDQAASSPVTGLLGSGDSNGLYHCSTGSNGQRACFFDNSTTFDSNIAFHTLEKFGINAYDCATLGSTNPFQSTPTVTGLYNPCTDTADRVKNALASQAAKNLLKPVVYTSSQLRDDNLPDDAPKSSVFTVDELTALLTQAVTITKSGAYRLLPNDNITAKIPAILNGSGDTWGVVGNWIPVLQQKLNAINDNLASIDLDENSPITEDLSTVRDFMQDLLTRAQQFRDGMIQIQDLTNQTGQSAALGWPGTIPVTDSNGKQTGEDLIPGNSDLITQVMAGNFTVMPLIGRVQIAKALSKDRATQNQIISQLKIDVSKDFPPLSLLGIDESVLIDKGFEEGDFLRIFEKNLGNEVFERIGKAELLRLVWDRAEINDRINQVTNSDDVQQITKQVSSTLETLSFYTDRLNRLAKIRDDVVTLLASNSSYADLANQLKAVKLDLSGNVISQIKAQSQSLEPLFKQASQASSLIKDKIEGPGGAMQIIEEMIAGHELSFQSAKSGESSDAPDICWSKPQLQDLFRIGNTKISDIAIGIASCKLDDALNLPAGSIKNWYDMGKASNWDYESFLVAIGRTSLKNLYLEYEKAKAEGERILKSLSLITLASLIPGFTQFTKRYGIGPEAIHAMLMGDPSDIIRAIGGQTLDTKMGWKAGTSADLILPQCADSSGAKRSCTAKEAENIRLHAMAVLGLGELGIALNLPASMDLTSGNLVDNYGKATIGEALGLRPNTFKGTFADVRKANQQADDLTLSSLSMTRAFGLDDDPYVVSLLSLYQQVGSLLGNKGLGDAGFYIGSYLQGQINTYVEIQRSKLLDDVSGNRQSPYWSDPLTDEQAAAMNADRFSFYQNALTQLFKMADNDLDGGPYKQAINAYLQESSQEKWSDQFAPRFKALVETFQKRLKSLDSAFHLDTGSMAKFVHGDLTADQLNHQAGSRNLTAGVVDNLLASYLQKNPDSILGDIVTGLQVFSGTNTCTVGQLFFGDKCKTSGIANYDLDKLLNSPDPQYIQGRAFLYDHIIARMVGANIDEKLNLGKGTVRSIILQPSLAPEILISQSLNKIGQELLKVNNNDNFYEATGKIALQKAFMAAFFDTKTNLYTAFDEQRALQPLNDALDASINNVIGTYSKEIAGVSISRADANLMLSGNVNGLYYFGLQRLITDLNGSLGTSSDPKKQARINEMKIDYNVVRASGGMGPIYDDTYQGYYQQQYVDTLRGWLDNGGCQLDKDGKPTKCMSDQEVLDYYKDDTTGSKELASAIAEKDRQDYAAEQEKKAREQIQYAVYDIAAFKLDPNIPKGFAYAMIKGNRATKLGMIGQYAFNALKLGQNFFGGLLNSEEFADLLGFFAAGFKQPLDANFNKEVFTNAVSKLDTWVQGKFKSVFGIDLPSGVTLGFCAWASTGFARNQFTQVIGKNDTNGLFDNVPSLGLVLKGFLYDKLASFADKAFGLAPGTTLKLFQAYDLYRKAAFETAKQLVIATKELKEAQATLDAANATGDADKIAAAQKEVDAKASTQGALQDTQAQLKADLITFVITTLFATQIAQAEKQLGLVPGTGAMAVGILVTSLTPGLAFPWVAFAIFVGMNLFGVYKVQIDVRGTGDGYYPYKGSYGSIGSTNGSPYQYPSADAPTGEFNPQVQQSYREGVVKAAQAKVQGVLADLLRMPEKWASQSGIKAKDLWISQIFTARQEDVTDLDYLISQPGPWSNPPGYGYGTYDQRSKHPTTAEQLKEKFGLPSDQRFGVFSNKPGLPRFVNEIYLAW